MSGNVKKAVRNLFLIVVCILVAISIMFEAGKRLHTTIQLQRFLLTVDRPTVTVSNEGVSHGYGLMQIIVWSNKPLIAKLWQPNGQLIKCRVQQPGIFTWKTSDDGYFIFQNLEDDKLILSAEILIPPDSTLINLTPEGLVIECIQDSTEVYIQKIIGGRKIIQVQKFH